MTGADYFRKRAQREAEALLRAKPRQPNGWASPVPDVPPEVPVDGTPLEVSITTIQFDTYQFMLKFRDKYGFPPTDKEVATAFGISESCAADRIWYLIQCGAIRKQRMKARGFIFVENVKITVRPSRAMSRPGYKRVVPRV